MEKPTGKKNAVLMGGISSDNSIKVKGYNGLANQLVG